MAGEQSTGRGRQGRRWTAPAGSSLLTSVLLRPAAEAMPLVPLIAGVATADALSEGAGLEVGLKWPNDVMVQGAKLAGLLAEVEPASQGRDAVALGLGLNLQVMAFPPGVCGVSLHQVVSAPPDWDLLLGRWLQALSSWLARTGAEGRGPLLDAWRRRAVGLGARVAASTPAGLVRGIASDIADDGALVITTVTGTTRLVAGDVHLVTESGSPGQRGE